MGGIPNGRTVVAPGPRGNTGGRDRRIAPRGEPTVNWNS
jgi:hypothetical protein